MLKSEIKKYIHQSFKKIAKKNNWPLLSINDIPLETPTIEHFGDYSTTIAFLISKDIKKSPLEIAEILVKEMNLLLPNKILKIEIARNGFINFYLNPIFIQKQLEKIFKDKESFGFSKKGKKEKIIIDYSSPNIAKPMHIGHLRSTIIGESLANLYECLGYQVIRWNYLGDWGTQFGKLIAAYKLWGNKKEIEKAPITTLLHLYRKFHQELKKNPELEKFGQQEFKKLEQGNKENRKIWLWFKKESLKEFEKIYNLLNIKFDLFISESFFEKDLLPLIDSLHKKELTQESQGAIIIPLEKYGLPPALIQKSDEASLYLNRDLALISYRYKKYQPEKILYVVGNEQDMHFKQVFTLAKILFPKQETELTHVKFGLVLSTEKKKFSTREGELISLDQVINEAIEKSLDIVKKKKTDWPLKKQEELAQVIALGALKFNDLKSFRALDVVFDWDKMLDFSGNTSVYLQYTYARINKILVKAKKTKNIKPNYLLLNSSLEIQLIKKLSEFPEIIELSAEKYAPNYLATYLLSLADLSNQYYESVPVLKEENKDRLQAQLNLLQIITQVLKNGLQVLGIQVLKEI